MEGRRWLDKPARDAIPHPGGAPTLERPGRPEISSRISQNHVTDCLVIFNIARASAEMTIERLSNGFFQISACYRPLGETFQQNLTLVQEPGGAIAALERKMVDESLLQGRKLTILRMPLDR